MAKCVYCGNETMLLDRGVPICLECSDRLDSGETPTRKPPAPENKSTIENEIGGFQRSVS